MESPVDTLVAPELPDASPVRTEMPPDIASKDDDAEPDAIVTLPELPQLLVPELKTMRPVSPVLAVLAVDIVIMPEEDDAAAPLRILIEPPEAVLDDVVPADSLNTPPSPLLVDPIVTEIEPAFPPVAVPVTTTIAPAFPDFVDPDST